MGDKVLGGLALVVAMSVVTAASFLAWEADALPLSYARKYSPKLLFYKDYRETVKSIPVAELPIYVTFCVTLCQIRI